jgi:NhaC family Na+:H+ antiporter
MYYGFTYMQGVNFLMAAFIIMVIVSVFMGTAVGTISTVGISLNGIGIGLGIPMELMIGVLVSGAFIADKISPLSGLVNLTMTSVNRNYKQIVKTLIPTLLPTIAVTAIIYYIIGLKYASNDYGQLIYYKSVINESFNTSIILLSLPVIVIFLSVVGFNSIVTISIGVVVGTILSMVFQHMTLFKVVEGIIFGYHGNTTSIALNRMLISGGMISMIDVILVVIGGVLLVKLFEKGGVLMPLMEKLMIGVKTKTNLILRTGFISSLMTVITCDQTVGIILPGRILQDKYKEFNLDNTVLARTISDTGTIIAPLMAWNVNSFIIKSIVGISATQYAPYAILCYICPAVTMASAYILYRRK